MYLFVSIINHSYSSFALHPIPVDCFCCCLSQSTVAIKMHNTTTKQDCLLGATPYRLSVDRPCFPNQLCLFIEYILIFAIVGAQMQLRNLVPCYFAIFCQQTTQGKTNDIQSKSKKEQRVTGACIQCAKCLPGQKMRLSLQGQRRNILFWQRLRRTCRSFDNLESMLNVIDQYRWYARKPRYWLIIWSSGATVSFTNFVICSSDKVYLAWMCNALFARSFSLFPRLIHMAIMFH